MLTWTNLFNVALVKSALYSAELSLLSIVSNLLLDPNNYSVPDFNVLVKR
jgi:hypothetical protein